MTKSTGGGVQRKLANALQLFTNGQAAAAGVLARDILKREPDNIEALHLEAMVAFQTGDKEAAESGLKGVLALRADHAPALNDLGMVLTRLGRYAEAEKVLVRALELVPEAPGFHLNLGNVYKGLEMWEDAERHYRAAIYYKRAFAEAFRLLSDVLTAQGKSATALKMAQTAVELNSRDPRGFVRLGEALSLAEQVAEAKAAYEQAVRLAPNDWQMKSQLGNFLSGRGFLDESVGVLREVIAMNPRATGAHSQIARSIKYLSHDDHMRQMEALLDDAGIEASQRAHLHFGLAKAYEDIGDYPTAFDHSIRGNAIAHDEKSYSEAANEQTFADNETAFTPELVARFAGAGCADETPIFVLGMPRSGTTLTEQTLASHPEVFGAGELSIFGALVQDLKNEKNCPTASTLLERITGEELQHLGERYVRRVREFSRSARFIVDKMPGNFMNLGMIRLALPKAKVIYCHRAAPDNCVSIFNIQFAADGMGYGYDLGELGRYYRMHSKLMAHWHRLVPAFIFDNRYEDMVSDHKGQARKLLDFCGLEWDEAVLSFFTTSRAVRTASKSQVRQPIYKSSVDRWRRYGDAIQPLLDALDWPASKDEALGAAGGAKRTAD